MVVAILSSVFFNVVLLQMPQPCEVQLVVPRLRTFLWDAFTIEVHQISLLFTSFKRLGKPLE